MPVMITVGLLLSIIECDRLLGWRSRRGRRRLSTFCCLRRRRVRRCWCARPPRHLHPAVSSCGWCNARRHTSRSGIGKVFFIQIGLGGFLDLLNRVLHPLLGEGGPDLISSFGQGLGIFRDYLIDVVAVRFRDEVGNLSCFKIEHRAVAYRYFARG